MERDSIKITFFVKVFMADTITTLLELKLKVDSFLKERDWYQFHNPKTDSMNIAIEAAELMEIFLYTNTPQEIQETLTKKREHTEDELADILFSVVMFANTTGIDLSEAFIKKLAKNAAKYPAHLVKGRKEKYNEYKDASEK